MHSVSISFGVLCWRLLYKTQEKAEEHFNFVTEAMHGDKTKDFNPQEKLKLEDDFGQRCSLRSKDINGVMIENMDESKLGNIEMALHGARTQTQAQRQAETDPVLRASRVNAAMGPAIISPMGNGRMS